MKKNINDIIGSRKNKTKTFKNSLQTLRQISAQYSDVKEIKEKEKIIVDENVLKGISKNKWSKIVKESLKKKFPDGFIVNGQMFDFNRVSLNELTNSSYTRYLSMLDEQLYKGKLLASKEIDDVIKIANSWINEKVKHKRRDDIKNFARGKVTIEINGTDYNADVLTGIYKDGKVISYDIVKIKKASDNTGPKTNRNTLASGNNISNSNKKVNKNK